MILFICHFMEINSVFFSKPPAEYRFTSVAVEFVLDKYKKHEN